MLMNNSASMTRRCAIGLSAGVAALACFSSAKADEVQPAAENTPSFLVQPEPITDIAGTADYDVIVVGAGQAGMAAAMHAAELGAKVALLQKLAFASTQGFTAVGLDSETDDATREGFVSYLMLLNDLRSKRELLEAWAKRSGEVIKWHRDFLTKAGAEVPAEEDSRYTRICNGYEAHFLMARPKGTHAATAQLLADYAQANGVDVFYETPGVQLVCSDGAVTGVIAGTEGNYTQFNASKGVILATGDYQCNEEMIAYYCPDALYFPPLIAERTGDGHRMGTWAGGHIEPLNHTKMIHDVWMQFAPYMMVDESGKRFCDEHIPWFRINNLMRDMLKAHQDDPENARVFSIFDSAYVDQATEWAAYDENIVPKEVPADQETLGDYALVNKADTLEGLAELINIDPEVLVSSVERYNELVDKGADDDFGKDARYLAKIEVGPFYAVQRDFNWGLSATLGGLVIDEKQHVLDDNDEPIPGLFAAGNCSGPFFGAVDYPMTFGGLSIGRCITGGYIAAEVAMEV